MFGAKKRNCLSNGALYARIGRVECSSGQMEYHSIPELEIRVARLEREIKEIREQQHGH